MRAMQQRTNPPIFNIPTVLSALALLLVAIHGIRIWVLSEQQDILVLTLFAFIPGTITLDPAQLMEPLSRFWSPLTYALLHGDWTHLGVNTLYLVAFGAPVARRFGTVRFLALMVAGALGGAAAHYIVGPDEFVPMIGASASVSACMGAAARFALTPGTSPTVAVNRPALSLGASLANRGVMTFVLVWFALNWLFGSGLVQVGQGDASIAWQAHIGGFVIGWLGFALFDPIGRAPVPDQQ